ncbi:MULTISPECIES: LysR substrate-binding domain-containing protein [unclassified Sphingobium]|uniref:LysR substrate-binding domain-containing protein n=1 Tax=unclassified Sphingobium TaxID=2611147 RepID=UPI0035A637AE
MDSPSLRQLDLFAQMMAAGSAARCADDLGVGVEQVLAEIAALEMRLGYRLFDDPAGAARLTAAGRKTAQAMTLLGQDAPAPDESDDAFAAPVLPPERARQTLVLAAPAPVFGHLQDALAAFEAANEDIAITLDLHVHSAHDAAAALAAGRADIVYFYALEEPADLPSRYGWSEPLSLYVGSGHPLARAETVGRDALAITPALALGPGGGLRQVTDAALARGRAALGPVLLESDDMAAIVAALREGAGCFPAFGPLARDLGRMPGITRLPLDMPLPGIEVRQAIGPRAKEKAAVEALADFLFL